MRVSVAPASSCSPECLAAYLAQAHQVTDDSEGWPIRVYTSSFLQEVVDGFHGVKDKDVVPKAVEEDQIT